SALEAVDRFAREGIEIILLALPQQETADEVVEEDRPHQLADVPRFPFEFPLKVRDHESPLAKPVHEDGQTHMIRFLRFLHSTLPTISSSSPSVSFSSARMSARISSSVPSGCGL